MRSKGSKIEPIPLKIHLLVSAGTLSEALNLSISIIASQEITITLSVSNSPRSKLTTFDDKLLSDRLFKVMRLLLDINVAKLKQPIFRKGARLPKESR